MKKKRDLPAPLTWAEATTLDTKERKEWQKRLSPRAAMARRFALAKRRRVG